MQCRTTYHQGMNEDLSLDVAEYNNARRGTAWNGALSTAVYTAHTDKITVAPAPKSLHVMMPNMPCRWAVTRHGRPRQHRRAAGLVHQPCLLIAVILVPDGQEVFPGADSHADAHHVGLFEELPDHGQHQVLTTRRNEHKQTPTSSC